MKTIYLIGFMGSGKTTVGRELKSLLELPLIDMDEWIEEKLGKSISTIFEKEGEAAFRIYETDVIQELDGGIISTGGGIIEKAENIQIMKEKGIIIYLKTSFDEIDHRLQNDSDRPLWKTSIDQRKNLFNRRCPLYEKYADLIINTDLKSSTTIAEEIVRKISE